MVIVVTNVPVTCWIVSNEECKSVKAYLIIAQSSLSVVSPGHYCFFYTLFDHDSFIRTNILRE